MRICVAYDCLFPYTVGGAERWYANLASRLAAEGHDVTYLTLRQWPRHESPDLPGLRVVAVGPRLELYTANGRRRIWPPLRFGWGVLRHLSRHGDRYDVVHTASFPYFSVLAAAVARRRRRFRLFVDWHEVWTAAYWREYLGPAGGLVGRRVQQACVRVPQTAFCFSRLHERRLRELGFRGSLHLLRGEYAGPLEPIAPEPAEPVVVFAGRHIPEKRVPAAVLAIAAARERVDGLRGILFGDGPERPEVLRLIGELGLDGAVTAPGFVPSSEVDGVLRRALCLLLPSRREGYGLVVVEAAAVGTPSVVVRDDDNAATELISEGENGFVAPSADPQELAEAIVQASRAGDALRRSTASWFGRNAQRLSLEKSLETVLSAYRDDE
jgi:glycosyltransferase involved in cell wall biosynthesis